MNRKVSVAIHMTRPTKHAFFSFQSKKNERNHGCHITWKISLSHENHPSQNLIPITPSPPRTRITIPSIRIHPPPPPTAPREVIVERQRRKRRR